MKSLQRKSQVCTCFLVIVVDTLVWIQIATAQLSLSTPTVGVQCYGDPVTLVCTHPVLPQEPEYLQADVTWMRDGTAISTVGLGRTNRNSTATRLQFTITENTTGNYTCFLVNLVQSRADESNSFPVTPLDLTPPHITNMDPLESSITVKWITHPCAVMYRVSWNYTNDDGTTTIGSRTLQFTNRTTITPNCTQEGCNLTVSVQAVDGVGNVGPATSEVVRSTYPRPTADASPCKDRSLVLTCLVSGLHNNRRSHFIWMDGNGPLDNSDQYSITGDQLMITNISAISGEKDNTIRCCEVLNNGIIVEGVEYDVEPLAQPGPPEVTTTTTDSTITLTWNTTLRCFEVEMFTFVVIWNETGSGTSTNETTSSSPYTISGLQPGTSYQISVQGVGGSGVGGGTRVLIVTTTSATPSTGGVNPIAFGVPIAVFGLVLTGAVVVILIACVVWRYRRSRKKFFPKSEQPESGSTTALGRRITDQGGVQAIRNQPQTASQRTTTVYAELDHSGDRPVPVPPPSLEKVTYTEVGTKPSKDVDTSPELPPKQDHQQIKAFRDDVKAVLDKNGVICKDLEEKDEKKGFTRENAFTAEYNGIESLAICVQASSDLTMYHVNCFIEAIHLNWVKVGLLISDQATMSSECLLTLEDAGCQFVPVSGYGEEGWEDRMIDKFIFVFPKVANNDSESEDLPTSVQETSPPPDRHDSEPPADAFRSRPYGDIDCTQTSSVGGLFMSTSDYQLEDDDTVPLIE